MNAGGEQFAAVDTIVRTIESVPSGVVVVVLLGWAAGRVRRRADYAAGRSGGAWWARCGVVHGVVRIEEAVVARCTHCLHGSFSTR